MWSSAVNFQGAGAFEGREGTHWAPSLGCGGGGIRVWEDAKEAGAPGRAGLSWTGSGRGMETRGRADGTVCQGPCRRVVATCQRWGSRTPSDFWPQHSCVLMPGPFVSPGPETPQWRAGGRPPVSSALAYFVICTTRGTFPALPFCGRRERHGAFQKPEATGGCPTLTPAGWEGESARVTGGLLQAPWGFGGLRHTVFSPLAWAGGQEVTSRAWATSYFRSPSVSPAGPPGAQGQGEACAS